MKFSDFIKGIFLNKGDIEQHVQNVTGNVPTENDDEYGSMTFGRDYRPSDDDIFYHYCSVETFKSIVQNKTIRFSDINMMNDYAESNWGYGVFIEAANRLLDLKPTVPLLKDLDKTFLDYIDEIIGSSQSFVHPVVACFSKSPDVLSQWRAYAENGRGFAVGFSGRVLKNLPVTILNVEYNREVQVEETRNAIGTIYVQYLDAGKKFDKSCATSARVLAAYLYAYKNPGFAEENEVRCVHLLDVENEDEVTRLVDAGGTAGGNEVEGETVKFRISDGGIVAFIDLPFDRGNDQPYIDRVVIGPANVNPLGNVRYLLGSEGLQVCDIVKSQTTFRS